MKPKSMLALEVWHLMMTVQVYSSRPRCCTFCSAGPGLLWDVWGIQANMRSGGSGALKGGIKHLELRVTIQLDYKPVIILGYANRYKH